MAEIQQPSQTEIPLPSPKGLGTRGHVTDAEFRTAIDAQQLAKMHEPSDKVHITSVREQLAKEQNPASMPEHPYQIPQSSLEKYQHMSSSNIRRGIRTGTITDMDAYRIMHLKLLEEDQALATKIGTIRPEERTSEIQRHKWVRQSEHPLIYGSADIIAKALADEANMAETIQLPEVDDYDHPSETNERLMAESRSAVPHLRAMQRRFEHQAQLERGFHTEATKREQQETGSLRRNETSTVQSESKPSQQKAVEHPQQAFHLVTGEGKDYTLNLYPNATLEEVQAKLQAEGAADLARYLNRFIFVPEGQTIDATDLQEVAQSYTTERMQKYERASQSGKLFPYKVTSKDGREFTLQLPKYPTIHDIRRAKQEQGLPVKQDEVEVIVPRDPTLTEATRDLLLVDVTEIADIPGMLKDIWKAIKKNFNQSTRQKDEVTNEK